MSLSLLLHPASLFWESRLPGWSPGCCWRNAVMFFLEPNSQEGSRARVGHVHDSIAVGFCRVLLRCSR